MDHKDVPYIVFESIQTRNEKQSRRKDFIILILIVVILINNLVFQYAWTQYDYTSTETTYTQDGEGINVIGDSNDVTDKDSKN